MASFGIHRTPLSSSVFDCSLSPSGGSILQKCLIISIWPHYLILRLSKIHRSREREKKKAADDEGLYVKSAVISKPTLRQAVEEKNGANRCNKRELWRESGRLEVSGAAPEPFAKITAPLKGPPAPPSRASLPPLSGAIYFSITLCNERHYLLVCQQRLHRSYD